MRVTSPSWVNKPTPTGRFGLKRFIKLVLLLLITIGLIYAGWRIYDHFKKSSGTSTVSQYERSSQNSNNSFLHTKDYNSYISGQVLLAGDYLATNDNKNAERVMNEVFTDVPTDRLNSAAYSEMVNVQQALGNTDKYKYYLNLLVKQLNKEGDTKGAAAAQALLGQAK